MKNISEIIAKCVALPMHHELGRDRAGLLHDGVQAAALKLYRETPIPYVRRWQYGGACESRFWYDAGMSNLFQIHYNSSRLEWIAPVDGDVSVFIDDADGKRTELSREDSIAVRIAAWRRMTSFDGLPSGRRMLDFHWLAYKAEDAARAAAQASVQS